MNDLERYLKNEYGDLEYRRWELSRQRGVSPVWSWGKGLITLAGLCLLLVNLLYWSP